MRSGQTKQFDTFDNLSDRREMVILFERLGEGLPELDARKVRAKFLQDLIPHSVSSLADNPLIVSPCGATDAYFLFINITGVLGVPIADGARLLEDAVRRREWMKDDRRAIILGT